MILNTQQKDGGRLSEQLCISEGRRLELQAIIKQKIEAIENNTEDWNDITPIYKELAASCDNLEEYTFCIHTFATWVVVNCEILPHE